MHQVGTGVCGYRNQHVAVVERVGRRNLVRPDTNSMVGYFFLYRFVRIKPVETESFLGHGCFFIGERAIESFGGAIKKEALDGAFFLDEVLELGAVIGNLDAQCVVFIGSIGRNNPILFIENGVRRIKVHIGEGGHLFEELIRNLQLPASTHQTVGDTAVHNAHSSGVRHIAGLDIALYRFG